MSDPSKRALFGLNFQELTSLITSLGEPAYRARQLFDWVYGRREQELSRFSTLPNNLRRKLADLGFNTGLPNIAHRFVSADGTIRYLLTLCDGKSVETVWMPEGDGEEGDDRGPPRRATICVSSQVGCAVNCQFCFTALLAIQRNLTAGEIAGQVALVLNDQGVNLKSRRINLVFMGQGEPFLNFENFLCAVSILKEGMGVAESGMTVSTSGILPRIYDFGREPVRPRLAISLNAPNDQIRDQIMPINRKWKIAELMAAARAFPLRLRERLTFEYVLLKGINDRVEHAAEVADLVRGMRCKVNLIVWNPGPEFPFEMPDLVTVAAFQAALRKRAVPAFVRKPRGRDIYAACGQLKRALA